jgi:hypothetical protein
MPLTILVELKEEWQEAWQSSSFRKKTITGLLLALGIAATFPFFFQTIEKRSGYLLQDPIVAWLPPHNVSLAIFVIIWTICALTMVRAAQNPTIFLTFVWVWIPLTLMRLLAITLVPLEPPVGLVGLVDPISNFFYGEKFVTKDLFFSGHTSTVFLLCLCLTGRRDRLLALIATVAVGFLLLVQHVHYTLDVLGALLFTKIAYWGVRKTILKDLV